LLSSCLVDGDSVDGDLPVRLAATNAPRPPWAAPTRTNPLPHSYRTPTRTG